METQYTRLSMTPSGVPPVIYMSQNDIGRPIGFICDADLSDYSVVLEGTRTDGTPITVAVTVDGNICAFETTATMTNKADVYIVQIVVTNASGKHISSIPIKCVVVLAAMDENSEGIEEDAPLYQQYTGTVQSLIADIRTQLNTEAAARQAADNTLQSNINSEASTRATADAALQSQINQLVAPEGAAPSAAEITNARVGADGTVYQTLGDAIRGQVTDVKSAIDYTNNATGVNINLWNTSAVVPNHYFANGAEVANDNTSYIMLPCKSGDTFYFGTDGNAVNARFVNILTNDGKNISTRQDVSSFAINGSQWPTAKKIAITFNNSISKIQINKDELLPYVPYGSSLPMETLPQKVDKNGEGQITPLNLEGVAIGNYFAFAELDREGAYAYANNAGAKLTYAVNSVLNCYFVPVKKNTDYNITFGRYLTLLDANKRSLAVSMQNVTTFNSGEAKLISVSFNTTTYPVELYKICETGVDTTEKYIFPSWLRPVSPVEKTDAMTIPVGVDQNGKLYAKEQVLTPKTYKSFYAEDDNLATGEYIIFDKQTSLKKGESLLFACNVTAFDKLIVGWSTSTPDAKKYLYCEITNTSIIVHGTNSNGPAAPTLTHGLTISVNLQFRMTIKHDSIDVELISNGERFTGTAQVFKNGQGYGFAMSDGSTLTNCKLSWCPADINKKIWMFGDSYFGMTNTARWLYYAQSAGFADNALIDAYAGRASDNALVALNGLITLGKPDYIVWCMGMNDGADTNSSTPSSAWVTGRDAVLSICESYGIVPIFATIPNVPSILHTGKNAWVKASGYRYIDFAKAVGAEAGGSSWYAGMLTSDNVHPTSEGAKALYGQALADFPEITITD